LYVKGCFIRFRAMECSAVISMLCLECRLGVACIKEACAGAELASDSYEQQQLARLATSSARTGSYLEDSVAPDDWQAPC
jgi:hypothetical protein